MIKPDAVKRGLVGEIISQFEAKGFFIKLMVWFPLPDDGYHSETVVETMKELYESHTSKPYYQKLMDFVLSDSFVIIFFEGNLNVARKIVGETVPWEAQPQSIRGKWANSLPENLVHCSKDLQAAKREIELWGKLV